MKTKLTKKELVIALEFKAGECMARIAFLRGMEQHQVEDIIRRYMQSQKELK